MPHNMIDRLHALVDDSRALVILTGAGCSTESGIPDYRSPSGEWRRHKPALFEQFRRSARVRQRYWARNYVGWPRMQSAQPNSAHRAIATMETLGFTRILITQNVDGLHQAAGSRQVIELHGSTSSVICLDCSRTMSRLDLQLVIDQLNPGWNPGVARLAPDADASVDDERVAAFKVPDCPECGGILKPDVVFFGENVPRRIVDSCFARIEEADAVMVVGSSLAVWSGYRFVRAAAQRKLPIAIVNIGVTRGDEHASLKIEERCGAVLAELEQRLLGTPQVGRVPLSEGVTALDIPQQQ
ncbi:MAG: NAD-dependent protein deacetylase [Acidobacteria bacterium]|nr:NAD-dependent protein deacetylase [Acidobacteriota bacterium]